MCRWASTRNNKMKNEKHTANKFTRLSEPYSRHNNFISHNAHKQQQYIFSSVCDVYDYIRI